MPGKLIEQAIIDANDLRETAIKVAQNAILEKYSQEFKENFDRMLEQEEDELPELPMPDENPMMDEPMGDPMMDEPAGPSHPVVDQLPLAAMDGEEGQPAAGATIVIDFDQLSQMASEPVEDEGYEVEDEMSHEDLVTELPPEEGDDELSEDLLLQALSEDFGLFEDVEEAVEESMDIDMDIESDGWVGANDQEFEERDLVKQAKDKHDDKVETHLDADKNMTFTPTEVQEVVANISEKIISEFADKIKELKAKNKNLGATLKAKNEKLNEMNVFNARLLYANRILTNPSLNEQQKRKIVERLNKCETIKEAKDVFTSNVSEQRVERKAPQTLDEAVANKGHVTAGRVMNGRNNGRVDAKTVEVDGKTFNKDNLYTAKLAGILTESQYNKILNQIKN